MPGFTVGEKSYFLSGLDQASALLIRSVMTDAKLLLNIFKCGTPDRGPPLPYHFPSKLIQVLRFL